MRIAAILLLIGSLMTGYAQDLEAIIKGEKAAFEAKKNFKSKRSGQQYDILYHKIKLNIDPGVRNIFGSVYSEVKTKEDDFTVLSFDLDDSMLVDSVYFEGAIISYVHTGDEVVITIPTRSLGEVLNTEIFYRGNPSKHSQNGFSYGAQKDGPIAWTLSEPYGAYGWWPCKQQLRDKIDSIDLDITIPKGNKAASLGLLTQVDTLADSSLIFHWKHRHPVATYLVAVAVTNYYEESHYIPLSDGDSLYHLDYLYPAYKSQADTLRWKINGMMRGFDSLLGPYPFRDEKYGHAMFGRGGGMEHQTMSFMGSLNFNLMAHELAHQWFGDKITCGSWQHLWLNESWATYSTALARELVLGKQPFLDFMIESREKSTENNGGSVYAYDTSNVGNLFDGNLRYRKGCVVLHQLRWELGDSAFFAGTRDYLAKADLCYGFAYTIDFQESMERVSGKDLEGFFDRYIYKEGFPALFTRWNRIGLNKIRLKVNQIASHSSVSFFPLKIEYRAIGEGRDSFFTVSYIADDQIFNIDVGFKVTELVFDPNEWLFAKGTLIEGNHVDLSAISIYPNPSFTSLSVFIKDRKLDVIEVLDMQGKVLEKKAIHELKNTSSLMDVSGLSNGIYLLRVTAGEESIVLKFIKSESL